MVRMQMWVTPCETKNSFHVQFNFTFSIPDLQHQCGTKWTLITGKPSRCIYSNARSFFATYAAFVFYFVFKSTTWTFPCRRYFVLLLFRVSLFPSFARIQIHKTEASWFWMNKLYFSIPHVQCFQIQSGLYCHAKLCTTEQGLNACTQLVVEASYGPLSGVVRRFFFWKDQWTTIVPVLLDKGGCAGVKPIQFYFPINERQYIMNIVHGVGHGLFDDSWIRFQHDRGCTQWLS